MSVERVLALEPDFTAVLVIVSDDKLPPKLRTLSTAAAMLVRLSFVLEKSE